MKGITRYNRECLILLIIGIFSFSDIHAQQQKIGYVDTDVILAKIPEYQGVDQQLRILSQEWKKELDRLDEEISQLKEDYEAKEILYTEEVRKQRQEEIRELVEKRERYMEQKFGADGEYYAKQKELLEPIQRKVFQAINNVAERGDYDFVFDRAGDTSMLYFREEWNLNDEVLRELGINTNQTSN